MNTAWTVNLARHVEPRLVGPGQVAALLVIGGLAAFALGFQLFAGGWP